MAPEPSGDQMTQTRADPETGCRSTTRRVNPSRSRTNPLTSPTTLNVGLAVSVEPVLERGHLAVGTNGVFPPDAVVMYT